MASKRELTELMDELGTLKILTKTYQQIAANHIRRARTSVVNNRDFITELLTIFQEVKNAYRHELTLLMKKSKAKDTTKFSLIKRNGKTTAVLLGANTGLYGPIVGKTATMLSEYLKKNEADVTIIGKLGERMFALQHPGISYAYFDFPDNKIDPEQLKKITLHLLQYEKILVFYGQFQSIVTQNPVIASLDGGTQLDAEIQGVPAMQYFFEPSLEKIVVFFEREIFGLVFEQSIRESQLAKHASRMYTLDNAIQNINDQLKKTGRARQVLHHRELNSKQLNSLTGVSMW